MQYKLPIILSIQAERTSKRKFKQNLCNNPENSKLMSTAHKHCYDMKAQTDNAEDINDNRFSILFLWVTDSNNKDNSALEKSLHFEIWRTRSYALYKRSCYTRETGTIAKFNFEATKFKTTSFVCSLASFYVAYP